MLPPLPPAARLPLLVMGMVALVSGVLAGLARLGVAVPAWAANHAGGHGALMVAAFFGTVIALERAVALNRGWPYLAPLLAGLGGLFGLAGWPQAPVLTSFAALLFVLGNGLILRQQAVLHLTVLALGALCWLLGNLLWGVRGEAAAAVPWWMAFLLLTIAGERLELTRFLPTPSAARHGFAALVALLLLGAALSLPLLALGMLLMAAWLARFDIARRTVRQQGLTRFIAVCLLAGYGWLGVAGLAGLSGAFSPGAPWRDLALHAFFVGFVFSMVFGHAAIIFPAVLRVKIPYHPVFYLPLAVLHATLLLRVGAGLLGSLEMQQAGGLGNAIALLLFVLVMLSAVIRGKRAA